MTPEVLAAARERDMRDEQLGDRRIEIWPDMAPAVLTFFSMATQWKRGPMGELTGLDYSAVQPVAAMLDLVLDTQAFLDLQLLEREALRQIRR